MRWSELVAGDVLHYPHEGRLYVVVKAPAPHRAGSVFLRVLLLEDSRVYTLSACVDTAVSPGIEVLRAEGP